MRPGAAFRHLYHMQILTCVLQLKGCDIERGCRFIGSPIVRVARESTIRFGERAVVRSDRASNPLSGGIRSSLATVREGAVIDIGPGVGMSSAAILCASAVVIGADTLIGAGAMILDHDAHPLCAACRSEGGLSAASPVRIGAGCFLGARCIVLKGVCLGDGCVVGAGAVVTSGEYPPGSVIVGNPARVAGSVGACTLHESWGHKDE